MKLGQGIFIWNSRERRTCRYGLVYFDKSTFNEDVEVKVEFDQTLAESLLGLRVKLTATVLEARESGHAGDQLCEPQIFPSKPEVGETLVLGIGKFILFDESKHQDSFDRFRQKPSQLEFGVEPDEERDDFWLDPRTLYRLHDQTVSVDIVETDEACLPKTDVRNADDGRVVSNGDGTLQTRCQLSGAMRVKPNIRVLEPGLLAVQPPAGSPKGERFELLK